MNVRYAHGYALVIGVGDDLPSTVNDARGLADLLVDPSRCAFPTDQVRVLTGKPAHRNNVLASLDWLATRAQADPEAMVLVYFSGHGVAKEDSFLLSYGWDLHSLPETAIAGAEFADRLRAIRSRQLLVLLDCCHAGGMAEAKGLQLAKSPVPPGLFDELKSSRGRVVLASSRKDEVSYTGRPYSVFTAALLEALAGYGALEKDGYARVLDMALWVGRKVPERTDEQQHPIIKVSNLEDNFALAYYAGGAKEPRQLKWAHSARSISPELDTEHEELWRRMLRSYRENLLLIEERISEYAEFSSIPLRLIRDKWAIEERISGLSAQGIMDQRRKDTSVKDEAKRVHPVLLGLYASCRANRDYYRNLGMGIEADVFEAYMKRMEHGLGVLSTAPDSQEAEQTRHDPVKRSKNGAVVCNADPRPAHSI
jgi:hypothetical protein